jgi:hypothetical protein
LPHRRQPIVDAGNLVHPRVPWAEVISAARARGSLAPSLQSPTAVWREWQGDDVGTLKQPNVGLHRLYAILTTEPNGVVQPIHDKAMPVLLMTAEDVDVWLNGTLEEALKLQKPRADEEIVITSLGRNFITTSRSPCSASSLSRWR